MIILSIGYPATGHLRKNVFPATADNLGIGRTYGIPTNMHWKIKKRDTHTNKHRFYFFRMVDFSII